MQLIEAVEWPQKHQEAFKRIGTRPPTGVLMFGSPGCSKTLLARAVASEAGLNLLAVKGPELLQQMGGESEKAVRTLFAKARANALSIIFFDEIDGLAVVCGKESDGVSVSDRVCTRELIVTVIAATDRPDKIDAALLRPGCLINCCIGPPDEEDPKKKKKKKQYSTYIYSRCHAVLTYALKSTSGCTGREAAIGESLDAAEITMEHLKAAIRLVVHSYQELSNRFQRLVHSAKDD